VQVGWGVLTSFELGSTSALNRDLVPPSRMATLVALTLAVEMAIAAVLPQIRSQVPEEWAFWLLAATQAFAVLYLWVLIPETLAPSERKPLRWSSIHPLHGFDLLLRYRLFFLVALLSVCSAVVVHSMDALLENLALHIVLDATSFNNFSTTICVVTVSGCVIIMMASRHATSRQLLLICFLVQLAGVASLISVRNNTM